MGIKEILAVAVVWLIWIYFNGIFAFRKRRNVAYAMLGSLLFTPLPVSIYLLFSPRIVTDLEKNIRSELILQEAILKALEEKKKAEENEGAREPDAGTEAPQSEPEENSVSES